MEGFFEKETRTRENIEDGKTWINEIINWVYISSLENVINKKEKIINDYIELMKLEIWGFREILNSYQWQMSQCIQLEP